MSRAEQWRCSCGHLWEDHDPDDGCGGCAMAMVGPCREVPRPADVPGRAMTVCPTCWFANGDGESAHCGRCRCCSDRCASVYGPERVQCTERADQSHEWHHGSGVDPEGEAYNAAWLSHWEPADIRCEEIR